MYTFSVLNKIICIMHIHIIFFAGLWGVVNNAGINFLGDIELTSMGQFQKICHVNQLGVVRVTKAFLPLIRKTQGKFILYRPMILKCPIAIK